MKPKDSFLSFSFSPRSGENEKERKLKSLFGWVLLALLACAFVAPTGLVYAQAVPSLVVESQEASPHFPDAIDFALRAHGFGAARAELNYRLVGEAVTSGVRAAVDTVSGSLDLKVTLDLGVYYVPPGAEVVYYWALTDGGGQTVYTPEKSFTLLDKRHPWKSLTDPGKRVSVHWYDGGDDLGRDLLDTASGALDRLQGDIGVTLQRPADVWLYADQNDLLDALPRNIPEWVGGKAFPELALVLAAITAEDRAQEIRRTVPHELSHLVLYQATRNPYNNPPAWFDEGLAMHNQEAHDPAEEVLLRQAAEEGRILPLKALSGSFGADEEATALSYAQSRSAIDFLLTDSRYGPEKFARTVAAFRKGVTYDEAFKEGLGAAVDDIDRQWRQSLPYNKAAAPGQAATQVPPAPSAPSISVWSTDLSLPQAGTLLALGGCAALFIAGAVITATVLVKRKT